MKEITKNLTKALRKEKQAGHRYMAYARVAQSEGYSEIADIFRLIARQEKEHAETLHEIVKELRHVEKGRNGVFLRIIRELKFPGQWRVENIKFDLEEDILLGNTVNNLRAAIASEEYSYLRMYPGFAEIAEKEGLLKIAERLKSLARAEEVHASQYRSLLESVVLNPSFRTENEAQWLHQMRGYAHSGRSPPR